MPRRYWKLALLSTLPLFPFAFSYFIAERDSWQPETIEIKAGKGIRALEFSPDGSYLIVSDANSHGENQEYYFCDLETRLATPLETGFNFPCIFLDNNHIVGWHREQIN